MTNTELHAQSLKVIRQSFKIKLKTWLPDFEKFTADNAIRPPLPQDIQELRMRTHQLAGSATTFGFEKLTKPAQDLECILDELLEGKAFSEIKEPLGSALQLFVSTIKTIVAHMDDDIEEKEHERKKLINAPYRVLVVDDDELVRKLLVDILEPEGCHVMEAEDGIKALNLMDKLKTKQKEEWPDMVVLDINMPEMSGVEVLKKLRQNEEWKEIPVLLLSRQGADNTVIEGLTSGAMDFITKPFDVPKLARRILETVRMHKVKLLVIDDDSLICQLLHQRFVHFGYTVLEAQTGVEGLKMIEDEKPDVVILDLVMPAMDGMSVLRHLQQKPEFIDLPILILSAKQQTQHIVEGLNNGARDYITKPFDLSILEARVKGIVQRRSMRRL